jgi:hypothetical protein
MSDEVDAGLMVVLTTTDGRWVRGEPMMGGTGKGCSALGESLEV